MPIRQASRTIIFEEFNCSTTDRLDLMLYSERLTDHQFYQINQRLSVKSFDEFMEKFNPTIYGQNLTDRDGNVAYSYYLERPCGSYETYRVQDDKFYRFISEIYESQGNISSDDIYNRLEEIISGEDVGDNSEEYKDLYKNMQEAFLHQMVNLIEKVLNVKAFFDHAAVNGVVNPEVIIANCKITDLMDGDTIESNFKTYIERMGNERTDQKIWYAVVPGIEDAEYTDVDEMYLPAVDDFTFTLDDEANIVIESRYIKPRGLISYDDFRRFMSIMNGSNIMVFFNFKANDCTSFEKLNATIVRRYKEKVEDLDNKEWGVLCYPNFSVIPKKHERYEIFPDRFLDFPSVYIDSSYIACAMMILAHNNQYLKDKGFPVNGDMPAVRFDYERYFKNDKFREIVPCWKVITTKKKKKNLKVISDDLLDELNEGGGFGFCFGSFFWIDGDELRPTTKNVYVYKARTILKEKIMQYNGDFVTDYCSIFKPLVKQTVRIEGEFGVDIAEMCSKANFEQSKRNINNLLYEAVYGSKPAFEESVEFDQITNTVSFKYSSNAAEPDFIIEI